MNPSKLFVSLLLLLSAFSGCCCYDVCSTNTCCPAAAVGYPDAPLPPAANDNAPALPDGGFIESLE